MYSIVGKCILLINLVIFLSASPFLCAEFSSPTFLSPDAFLPSFEIPLHHFSLSFFLGGKWKIGKKKKVSCEFPAGVAALAGPNLAQLSSHLKINFSGYTTQNRTLYNKRKTCWQ